MIRSRLIASILCFVHYLTGILVIEPCMSYEEGLQSVLESECTRVLASVVAASKEKCKNTSGSSDNAVAIILKPSKASGQ